MNKHITDAPEFSRTRTTYNSSTTSESVAPSSSSVDTPTASSSSSSSNSRTSRKASITNADLLRTLEAYEQAYQDDPTATLLEEIHAIQSELQQRMEHANVNYELYGDPDAPLASYVYAPPATGSSALDHPKQQYQLNSQAVDSESIIKALNSIQVEAPTSFTYTSDASAGANGIANNTPQVPAVSDTDASTTHATATTNDPQELIHHHPYRKAINSLQQFDAQGNRIPSKHGKASAYHADHTLNYEHAFDYDYQGSQEVASTSNDKPASSTATVTGAGTHAGAGHQDPSNTTVNVPNIATTTSTGTTADLSTSTITTQHPTDDGKVVVASSSGTPDSVLANSSTTTAASSDTPSKHQHYPSDSNDTRVHGTSSHTHSSSSTTDAVTATVTSATSAGAAGDNPATQDASVANSTANTVTNATSGTTSSTDQPQSQSLVFEEDCTHQGAIIPLPVYALVRFSNEIITLKQCLNSLLPTITRGVLITHRQPDGLEDDGSLEVALDFVNRNPGFKLVIYPHVVYHANHPIYAQGSKLARECYLDAYSNFGLQMLKDHAASFGDHDPWVFKADADHIYDSVLLGKQLCYIAKQAEQAEKVYLFAKLDVHYLPESDELLYLRTKAKTSQFLAKAKYVNIGMHIDKSNPEQIIAQEIYSFEDKSLVKLNLKQSFKVVKNYLSFKFIDTPKARQYRNTTSLDKNLLSQSVPQLATGSQAREYALHQVREVPIDYTTFINSIHFKYLKFVHTGKCKNLPQGTPYQEFLGSPAYQTIAQQYRGLSESELFNNLALLKAYCHDLNFLASHSHKLLVDYYASCRKAYQAQEQQ